MVLVSRVSNSVLLITSLPSAMRETGKGKKCLPAVIRHFSIAGCQTAHLFTDDVSPSVLAGRQGGEMPGHVILPLSGIMY